MTLSYALPRYDGRARALREPDSVTVCSELLNTGAGNINLFAVVHEIVESSSRFESVFSLCL